tara:strand:- start:30541 stop:30975 length:435 start_codon:yes stop_codon:yes gene_type:complete
MAGPTVIAVREEETQETSPANGESLEMYMVDKLIELTKQSVEAQNSTVNEVKELREDLKKQSQENTQEHANIVKSISEANKSRIRQVADWVAGNPVTSVMMFLAVSFSAILIVLVSQTINADSLNSLRNKTSVTPAHVHRAKSP